MTDNTKYADPLEFEIDLHSIYAAYLGYFESNELDWWEKSWGGYFSTFHSFLGFGWDVMVVVDKPTGRGHIGVREEQIASFAKMIRTRFGESLPKHPPTTLPLHPIATRNLSLRRLVRISDLANYRKLSLSLAAAELAHIRNLLRSGNADVVEQLFHAGSSSGQDSGSGVRDNGTGYTWASINTTWWEKGAPPGGFVPGSGRTQSGSKGLVLEVGIAVLRCANLHAVDVWPPIPDENYRKSHYIVEEWVDKRTNSAPPSFPRSYAFGRSRFVAAKDIERILDASLGGLASADNESNPNTLILLGCGDLAPLPVPTSSNTPNNILYVDILALEYRLFRRAKDQGLTGPVDRRHPLPDLFSLLQVLQIPVTMNTPLGNAGNDAFYTLLALQKLMMADTQLPNILFQPNQTALTPPRPSFAPSAYNRHSSYSSFGPPTLPRSSSSTFSLPSRPNSMNFSTSTYDNDVRNATFGSKASRSQTVYWDDGNFVNALDKSKTPQPKQKQEREQERATPTLRRPVSHEVLTANGSHNRAEPRAKDKPKSKPKGEKSVKDIAGALAKFWVG